MSAHDVKNNRLFFATFKCAQCSSHQVALAATRLWTWNLNFLWNSCISEVKMGFVVEFKRSSYSQPLIADCCHSTGRTHETISTAVLYVASPLLTRRFCFEWILPVKVRWRSVLANVSPPHQPSTPGDFISASESRMLVCGLVSQSDI